MSVISRAFSRFSRRDFSRCPRARWESEGAKNTTHFQTPKKSLVKIGEPSHTRRFASDRGEFSPNGVAILEFGPGRVKGSPIHGLRRQRRSRARLRGKQGRQSHLIPCGVVYGYPLTLPRSTPV